MILTSANNQHAAANTGSQGSSLCNFVNESAISESDNWAVQKGESELCEG